MTASEADIPTLRKTFCVLIYPPDKKSGKSYKVTVITGNDIFDDESGERA